MTETPVVRVADLRNALDRVLEHVERTRGSEINLGADYYWVVASAAAFQLNVQPAVTVGQLFDDLDSLNEQLSERATEEPVVWHDLEHLIGLLRWLADLDMPSGGAPS